MHKFLICKGDNKGSDQCWHWQFVDDKNQKIAFCDDALTHEAVVASIKNIRAKVTEDIPIVFDGSQKEGDKEIRFVCYENKGKFSWQLQNQGKIIATGDKGFLSKEAVLNFVKNIRKEIAAIPPFEYERPEDDPLHDAKQRDNTETRGKPGA